MRVVNRDTARRRWPWGLAAGLISLSAAAAIAGLVIDGDVIGLAFGLPFTALFAVIGAIIATQQPGNRIAWLLYPVGSGLHASAIIGLFMEEPPDSPTLGDYFAIGLSQYLWLLIFLPLLFLLYTFPSGRFLSRRWRWTLWLVGLMLIEGLFAGVLGQRIGPPFEAWTVDGPIGVIPMWVIDASEYTLDLPILTIGGFVAIVLRYRRSNIVVRTQIKWVLYSGVVFAITTIGVTLIEHPIISWAFPLALVFMPISITIAITRYRLFEIDRIVSRSVSYAVVVGLLAAVFGGVIALGSMALPTDSGIQVAAATLIAAGLFDPLRRRIQGLVDRRFNRSAFQVQAVTNGFADELQGSYTLERVTGTWVGVVRQHLQPSEVGV